MDFLLRLYLCLFALFSRQTAREGVHYFRNQNEALASVQKHNLYQPVDDSFVEKESEDKVEKLAGNNEEIDDAEAAKGSAEEDEGKKKEKELVVNLTKRIVTWSVVWDYF